MGGLLDLYRFRGLVILVQNSDFSHWLYGRGPHTDNRFCLQKSRMPLAGLVYLLLGLRHTVAIAYKSAMVTTQNSVNGVKIAQKSWNHIRIRIRIHGPYTYA